MTTIPASAIVQVTPSVLDAGGTALDIIGLLLTNSTRVPIGTIAQFGDQPDVARYFGASSAEAALATIYFAGFDNSNTKPELIKFAQYNQSAVPAYLRGGPANSMTIAQLQALPTGSLTVMIDGVNITAPSVTLASATSFSNAAAIIQAAFTATQASASSCTIAGTTLTAGGSITGTLAPGQTVFGVGVTAGSYIVAQLTGSAGGAGTYQLSASSTVGVAESMTFGVVPLVTFDSVSGGFVFTTVLAGATESIGFASTSALATSLLLTLATGAVTSPGAAAASPVTFMTNIVDVDQDWVTFMTTFDPDNGSGNAQKLAFATWNGGENNRYMYVCWDTDLSPANSNPAPASLGALIAAAQISGTYLIGGDGTNPVTASYAAFECGAAASIDFTEHNGRTTFAFRSQSGLVATASLRSKADNLRSNGYNWYGVYATANDRFIWNYPGTVSGDFQWADSYVDQIQMNNSLQLALMVLLKNTKSIPYNSFGYSLIEAAMLDTVLQAVDFGAIRAGVTLSQAQAAEVNGNAGIKIDNILQTRGWYIQVRDALPIVRQARQSPPVTLWYMDGQSVQQINVASIELK